MRTNGFAVASLVLSIVGFFLLAAWGLGGVPALLSVVFGHIARGQIRNEGRNDDGMATAGLIIGYCVLGLAALVILLIVVGILSILSLTQAGSI